MKSIRDYEKILTFLYECEDIPDNLRNDICRWMVEKEDDEEFNAAFLNIWNQEMSKSNAQVNPEALSRLLTEIESENHSGQTAIKRSRWKNILKYAAVAIVAAVASYLSISLFTKADSDQQTILLTAKGSVGEFTLPDGSLVRLNGDSRLSFCGKDFEKNGKRQVAVEGEAFFEVTKDPSHPFVVRMSKMEVEVLGTSFDVRNYPFSATEEVVLLSGAVKVNTDGKVMDLVPDQRLIYTRGDGDCRVEESDASKFCRWHESRIKLESESLEDLLTIISRKYCLDLDIAGNVDLSTRVSITLQNDPIEELMPILAYLTGIEWSISNSTLLIYK